MLLLLRAFASGCSALTGVEAVANGVPAFRRPKIKNAQTHPRTHGRHRDRAVRRRHRHRADQRRALRRDAVQSDRLGRLRDHAAAQRHGPDRRRRVRRRHSILFFVLQARRPPCCCSPPTRRSTDSRCSARCSPATATRPSRCDPRRPPRLLERRHRARRSRHRHPARYQANLTALIQLYIIGVFVSFTLGQTGMVRHWMRSCASRHAKTAAQVIRSLVDQLVRRAADRHACSSS